MKYKSVFKSVKTLIVSALAFCTLSSYGGDDTIEYDTKGVRLGYWTSDFAAAYEYAFKNNIPMMSFWSAEDCGYCARFRRQAINTDEFRAWIAKKPIVLVYTEAPSATRMVDTPVKLFTKGDNRSGEYPFIRLYWNKADDTEVSRCFTGRSGQMPVTTGKTAEQLVGTLEKYFGSWGGIVEQYSGSYFSVTNRSLTARLEAIPGKTTYVDIPMWRRGDAADNTNYLQVNNSTLGEVSWVKGVSEMTCQMTLPTTAKVGDVLQLKLYDRDKTTVTSTSSITMVAEPANDFSNPKWIGEEFDYGEWTMDLDKALADQNGYTLAVVGGNLWSKDKLSSNVFATDEFKQWAKDNLVNLVSIDLPEAGKTTATLLTRDESSAGASGAAYISRNSISEDDAEKAFTRNQKLSGTTWLPKSSTATRLDCPTVLLIDSKSNVSGRLYAPGTSYPIKETMNRLNELLLLKGSTNDKNTDPASTALTLKIEDSVSGALQVNDNTRFYKLTNVPAGRVTFTATGSKPLVLSLWEYSGSGALETQLGIGTNSVAVTFASTANKYLKVASFVDKATTYGTQTAFDFTVESTVTLVPSQLSATYTPQGNGVLMSITKGTTYKLARFASYAAFTRQGDGLYVANSTDTIPVAPATTGGSITYQIWTPGAVQFAAKTSTVYETSGSGKLTVTRTGGVSGKAAVTVAVDGGSAGTKRVSVSPATLTWAEGDSASKTVTYTITPQTGYNADETFKVSLAAASGNNATLGANKDYSLIVTDDDEPSFPQSSYSLTAFKKIGIGVTIPVNNLRGSDSTVQLTDGKLPRGVSMNYDAVSKRVIFTGAPTSTGDYSFTLTIADKRGSEVATGKSTFKVSVVDPKSIAVGDKGYNVILKTKGTKYATIPLYYTSGVKNVLAGTAEMSLSSTMRVTLKYVGLEGQKITFTGEITSLDEDGTATFELNKKGVVAILTITDDGYAGLSVNGVSGSYGSRLTSDSKRFDIEKHQGKYNIVSEPGNYSGYYTVTLPADEMSLRPNGEEAPTGTGYLTLKMNTAAFRKSGKVTWAGRLPNGQAISGTSYLSGSQEFNHGRKWACLPIVLSKAGANLSLMLAIREDAAASYRTDPQVLESAQSAVPFWTYKGSRIDLSAYGNCYDPSQELSASCAEYYGKTDLNINFVTNYFAPSAKYGAIVRVPQATIRIKSNSSVDLTNNSSPEIIKLHLTTRTGIVTGSAKVSFENGRPVTMTLYGVLLIGWNDCTGGSQETAYVNRPLFSGMLYYNDSNESGRIKRGFAVEFEM